MKSETRRCSTPPGASLPTSDLPTHPPLASTSLSSNHIVHSFTHSDRRMMSFALAAKAPVASIRSASQRRASVSPVVTRRAVVVTNAVKFDYDTKVFKKELVKFADTEEYIYRCVRIFCMCPRVLPRSIVGVAVLLTHLLALGGFVRRGGRDKYAMLP